MAGRRALGPTRAGGRDPGCFRAAPSSGLRRVSRGLIVFPHGGLGWDWGAVRPARAASALPGPHPQTKLRPPPCAWASGREGVAARRAADTFLLASAFLKGPTLDPARLFFPKPDTGKPRLRLFLL